MVLNKKDLESCTTWAVVTGGILTSAKTPQHFSRRLAGYSLQTTVNGVKRPLTSLKQNPKGKKKPRPAANAVDAHGIFATAVWDITDPTCRSYTYLATCDHGYNFDQVSTYRGFTTMNVLLTEFRFATARNTV
jgi:hypothetical protein